MEGTMGNKSLFFALAAVLFWSTVATAFKFSLRGMKPATLLFYSGLSSTLVLLSVVLWHRKWKNLLDLRYLPKNMLLGFLNPFLYYLVLFQAYSLLPAQEAQPLNYTWPITVAIFSSVFLKQKLTRSSIIGLLLAFLGVWIIAGRGNLLSFRFQNGFGVFLAVGSSLIWAAYWIWNLLDKRDICVKLLGSFASGTIFTGLYLLLFGSFTLKDHRYLLGPIYIGCFEMGITFLLWMKALKLSRDKAKTSTLAYLSPFISLFFISCVLGERLAISSIVGLVLIVSGIAYQQFFGEKQ